MNAPATPVAKDLVLVGGGHSHIAVLRKFGMRPLPGVQLTLVCRDVHTPYSGMLPGLIAGHYTFDEAHIDLRKLAVFARARFIHDTVTGLNLTGGALQFANRPPIPYDLLSLNIGSTPSTSDIPGADQFAVAVKPISNFLPRWESLLSRVGRLQANPAIAIVGAGAGGVELALAMQHRLQARFSSNSPVRRPEIHIFSDAPQILPTHNARTRDKFRRILARRGVRVHAAARVVEVTRDGLRTASGWTGHFHEVVWATRASAAPWLADSGLACDQHGFVLVDNCLRSASHSAVYAAGDVAAVQAHPREKAGVFAVRQGPPLERNLRRTLSGEPTRRFRPQRHFLGLISTGDRHAVASRGRWSVEGAWAWKWKDWIDRRFMRRFSDLPDMTADGSRGPRSSVAAVADAEPPEREMRCRGCASKLGATTLGGALASIKPFRRDDIAAGLGARDDAAILDIPPGKSIVQSVDFFPAIVDDPYLFGQITANHALGDLYAMDAVPQSALAIAGIPFGTAAKSEHLLRQMLLGAERVFHDAETSLAGGHTSECPELALGFVVNGLADRAQVLRKCGLQQDQALILSKPLGTGVLFAAEMRLEAKGRWIDAAIASMLQSSRRAAELLHEHGASACTDITGFGLAGHLVEMLEASDLAASLEIHRLPTLPGALECLATGVRSTLDPENRQVWKRVAKCAASCPDPRFSLLFDPQTAGGLLAGVPPSRAEACLTALRAAGYTSAVRIGTVRAIAPDGVRLSAV